MDRTPASLDFAVIGHQDSWQNITGFINNIRSDQEKLPAEKIKESYSFIPPRDIFRVNVKSATGREINGVYIETFIDPDKLDVCFARANIAKVMKAATWATKMCAGIVALGGFTSIVLEGKMESLTQNQTKFTTGNTLTAGFIVKAMERAALKKGIILAQSKVMVIGATGDIGTACVEYLKNKTAGLLLCARNHHRLDRLCSRLLREGITAKYALCVQDLVPEADIIICVASCTGLQLTNCKENVLICDAGYPKNLDNNCSEKMNGNIFYGGMGQVSCGYRFDPDYSKSLYHHEAPFVIHGCILEAMVLAFEKRFEPYSSGKGNITPDKIEEMYALSVKHGIDTAPFHNARGLW